MATEEHIVKIGVDDEASKAFEAAAKAADKFDDSVKKTEKHLEDLGSRPRRRS